MQGRGGEGSSLSVGNGEICTQKMNGGGKGKGVRVVCVSLSIVLICQATLSLSPSPPPASSVSPLAPGVCVADKREAEEPTGSRHGAVCLGRLPCRAREQVKGPCSEGSPAPRCLCTLPPLPSAGSPFEGMRQQACWGWLD